MNDTTATGNRIKEVFDRIDQAASQSGRTRDDITVVAVGKTHPAEDFFPVIEAGIRHFGESRIQEAEEKKPQLSEYDIKWHMIGHLQRNKAKNAIRMFQQLHSLDSKRLARRLQKQLAKEEISDFTAFIQVNTSGEESKYGIDPDRLAPLMDLIEEECPRLRVNGLMTMAPLTEEESRLRKSFSALRELAEKTDTTNYGSIEFGALSMGMTNDYEIAIQEGATHVRIGRAIFGERLSR
ncbi:MAG: YggS family pyridoxal phosphate-dependent enzyme [Candidatus Marinimicrobia bacterium]|nr:YggS family pyridoxal phosphate-dependent enzyme [Candidatus Neomarinimicrobiota bacterium]MCF7829132.1 YggS family pyridoxal phosphate-dependent enzyme [Candidatus Neomarinimicrobiota bacterium]MCF7881469.1 YggS family pyridoxal phosphate-dependent enzyme [Candidatus Neomarinimicrobiota bacterium]